MASVTETNLVIRNLRLNQDNTELLNVSTMCQFHYTIKLFYIIHFKYTSVRMIHIHFVKHDFEMADPQYMILVHQKRTCQEIPIHILLIHIDLLYCDVRHQYDLQYKYVQL